MKKIQFERARVWLALAMSITLLCVLASACSDSTPAPTTDTSQILLQGEQQGVAQAAAQEAAFERGRQAQLAADAQAQAAATAAASNTPVVVVTVTATPSTTL